jgi:adenosylmethionine-8-amino-7-oxononanoate aminotransferase
MTSTGTNVGQRAAAGQTPSHADAGARTSAPAQADGDSALKEGKPGEGSTLQEQAKRHLWMHFTRLSAFEQQEVPIIVRGEGCYVYDEHGKRYLDGLSALFCVNIGHGRGDVVQAGADQAKELGFFTNWSYAHPRAIELATRIAALAPGDLNRVFFTSGGSEAVESAVKLARQYFKVTGKPNKHKLIAREIAYHGTSLGALSATGITGLRQPFEPLTPGGFHVPATNRYRLPEGVSEDYFAESIAHMIEFEGPDTVAAVILEPVQNAGGCFTPPDGYFQRVREICDEYDVLLISDEVICAWGRLGEWFGAHRYDYQPDMITTAKGITSAYAPMGAVIASDRVAEPFLQGTNSFLHGFTFAGHPVCAAIAMANLDVFEREQILENVRRHESTFRGMLDSLREIPIVGDVRGTGFFYAIELVKDKETKESFSDEESETLLRGFLSGELYRRGLICRADDRGDPVIQLSPPLIAGPEQFEEIESILRPILTEAAERMHVHTAGAEYHTRRG